MRRRRLNTRSIEEEHEIEANYFAIELLMEENLFRRETDYLLRSPLRHDDYKGAIDLIDDPVIAQLAKKFLVSEQLAVIRLCMLGYFAPYVRGKDAN